MCLLPACRPNGTAIPSRHRPGVRSPQSRSRPVQRIFEAEHSAIIRFWPKNVRVGQNRLGETCPTRVARRRPAKKPAPNGGGAVCWSLVGVVPGGRRVGRGWWRVCRFGGVRRSVVAPRCGWWVRRTVVGGSFMSDALPVIVVHPDGGCPAATRRSRSKQGGGGTVALTRGTPRSGARGEPSVWGIG